MLAGCVAPTEWRGPLPVRNQHPAQLLVQSMPPRRAVTQAAGDAAVRTDAAYSSLFLLGSGGGNWFVMDGEYLRTSLSAGVGLGQGLELGVELPMAHTSGGFLDSFLIDYHEVFGFPDQARDTTPKNQFEVQAWQGSQQVWQMQSSSFEWLDVPLTLSWAPTGQKNQGPGTAVLLRAGIELPTGDQHRGYGNGQIDTTFGAVLEQRFEQVALYGHLQHTFAGTPAPSRDAGLQWQDVTAAGFGAELPLSKHFSAQVQLGYETSTLRDLDLGATARDQLLLWVGGRWSVSPAWSLEFAFGEDLISHVSPDFTAWVGAVWHPGR